MALSYNLLQNYTMCFTHIYNNNNNTFYEHFISAVYNLQNICKNKQLHYKVKIKRLALTQLFLESNRSHSRWASTVARLKKSKVTGDV